MKIKDGYHLYTMITQICWALAYVYTRLALQYYNPFLLGLLRFFVASVSLVFVMFFLKIKPPAAKDIIWFVIFGATGFSFIWFFLISVPAM